MPVSNAWIERRLRELPENPAVLGELYEEMKQPMYAVAYRIVISREDAEDVVQEAFLSLLRIRETDRIRNGRAYLFQMVRNEALKKLRMRDKETACENPEVYIRYSGNRGMNDLDRAMATLSGEERQIVSMHTEAGLTYVEIAKVTGSSTATVFRQYRKALRKLQQFFNVRTGYEEELI